MTESTSDPLQDFSTIVEIDVAWGEMDAFAHVNNVVYFRWFESARIAYLERIGFRGGGMTGEVGPILASTHCRFRRPLTYPDRIRVGARVTEIGEDRLTFETRIVSGAQGVVAADGGGVVVAFDYGRNQKAKLPEAVRRAIEAIGEPH